MNEFIRQSCVLLFSLSLLVVLIYEQRTMHCTVAIDTLSHEAKDLCWNVGAERLSALELRQGRHLASPAIQRQFANAVRRFRDTFTPEFVVASCQDSKLQVDVVSDFRSPSELRGRNHRISFVVFAYLDAQHDELNPEGTDLVYYSASTLKLILQRAQSLGRDDDSARVFVVVLIPYQHHSLERLKQLEFEANGQILDTSAEILSVFIDSSNHRTRESRRRLCYELIHHPDDFVEDTSAHESLLTLRKLIETGLVDYDTDSRKRTVDDVPVVTPWSDFLVKARAQTQEPLFDLIRNMLAGNDDTVPLPVSKDDDIDVDVGAAIEEDLYYNR